VLVRGGKVVDTGTIIPDNGVSRSETMNIHKPCLTRAAVLRWSAFRLPVAAGTVARRTVPALTLEQFRRFERRGCFDAFHFFGTPDRPMLAWKPRRRGATALYSIHDVATARLIAWMLHWGVPHRAIVLTLRGERSHGRAFLDVTWVECALVIQNSTGLVVTAEGLADYRAMYSRYAHLSPERDLMPFPLAWLGMGRAMPRISKELGKAPTVPLWNRLVPLETAISAQEARV
jgi:hypothetical protein